jgi:cation transport ATPase
MKFPKVTSIQINQLPTDSSVMTPQEKYIFDTIFLPEVDEFEKSSQLYQEQQQNLQKQLLSSQSQDKLQTKEHNHNEKSCHPFGKKLLISIVLTALIIVFAISPLPSLVKGSTSSPVILSAIIFAVFAVSFLFFQSYVKI